MPEDIEPTREELIQKETLRRLALAPTMGKDNARRAAELQIENDEAEEEKKQKQTRIGRATQEKVNTLATGQLRGQQPNQT